MPEPPHGHGSAVAPLPSLQTRPRPSARQIAGRAALVVGLAGVAPLLALVIFDAAPLVPSPALVRLCNRAALYALLLALAAGAAGMITRTRPGRGAALAALAAVLLAMAYNTIR